VSVITIFSGTFCAAQQVTQEVVGKLGYSFMSESSVVAAASKAYNVSTESISSAVHGSASLFRSSTRKRDISIARLKCTLAELLQADNIVLDGFTTHLLPKSISHVLRVCLIANQENRMKTAIEQDGLSAKNAKRTIQSDDSECLEWVKYLHDVGPWDESLYDIIIPMHSNTIGEAASLICEYAAKPVLKTTATSQKAMLDFLLASKVSLALVEQGHNMIVSADDGDVAIDINEHVIRLERLKEKLAAIASAVEGVKSVDARIGPKYQLPPLYRKIDVELPSKVLLVDDEKEFVQTLSARLHARDMASKVAYDGEEALSMIAKEEPEVMVLDLEMPGIHGMEVLSKVMKERPCVKVIILTGHGSAKDEALAKELGAFAYLEKPVDIDVLSKTMQEAYQEIKRPKSQEDAD
jgi:two-component system, OmpR family, response regulator CpxR